MAGVLFSLLSFFNGKSSPTSPDDDTATIMILGDTCTRSCREFMIDADRASSASATSKLSKVRLIHEVLKAPWGTPQTETMH